MKHYLPVVLLSTVAMAQSPAPKSLEFRIVAADDYRAEGVSFDLAAERTRLRAWLSVGQNRESVVDDPARIERFNGLGSDRGGPLSTQLGWAPRVLRATREDGRKWQPADRDARVVRLFSDQEHAAGPTAGKTELVELFPINRYVESFGGGDVDGSSVRGDVEPGTGRPSLHWAIKPERAQAFRAWTARNIGARLAILVGGQVCVAPQLKAELTAAGLVTGDFTSAEVGELADSIKAAVAASDTIVEIGTTGDVELPASADPADLRAMQGAQAMLQAERKLRDLIKAGKIEGIDRILTFEEISSWPYEDGLLGMPKSVGKVSGKNVLMTGFMLPIDEVENIKEFLLVQSLWSCCYGQPPDINGIVRVVMKGDARIDYQFEPIKVIGTFKVEATMEDGYCVDIYQLHADEVTVIR